MAEVVRLVTAVKYSSVRVHRKVQLNRKQVKVDLQFIQNIPKEEKLKKKQWQYHNTLSLQREYYNTKRDNPDETSKFKTSQPPTTFEGHRPIPTQLEEL